ncbi:hypothetical protein JCM10450v2_008065 [Rhodotorula kratochvilovae]
MASLVESVLRRRHDYSDLSAADYEELEHDPFEESGKYALASAIFLSSAVGIFAVINCFAALMRTRASSRLTRSKANRRGLAFYRFVEARQPKALGWIRFPTAGVISLISTLGLFVLVWLVAQRPFYYSRWELGSPPVAIRAGLFALGCLPFIFAFGARWNLIGFVVGCSHEKLKVFHAWLSYLFLLLSLVHTFPYVVQGGTTRPNEDGLNPEGWSWLWWSWQVRGMSYYWSGIAALVPLIVLCFGSLAPIRRRLHVVSKRYLWATAAIYFTSVAARWTLLLVRNSRKVAHASVEALSSEVVRATIPLVDGAERKWAPGQHFFVCFPKLRLLESRPYTVINSYQADPSRLILTFRLPRHTPLSARLLSLASSGYHTPVLLDGPYGGLRAANRDFARHETVVLIAGGTGMAFCTGVLADMCARAQRTEHGVHTRKVHVVWAVEGANATAWFEEQLFAATQGLPADFVSFHLYITGLSALPCAADQSQLTLVEDEAKSELSVEKLARCETASARSARSPSFSPSSVPWARYAGRPALAPFLKDLCAAAPAGSSLGVAACGPEGLLAEVRPAVAERQWALVRAREAEGGLGEVELHVEEGGGW